MKKSIIATILTLTVCGTMIFNISKPMEVQAQTKVSYSKSSVKKVSLSVPTIYTDTTKIKGKTVVYAWVQAQIGKKIYKAKADKGGNYTITIPKQTAGEKKIYLSAISKGYNIKSCYLNVVNKPVPKPTSKYNVTTSVPFGYGTKKRILPEYSKFNSITVSGQCVELFNKTLSYLADSPLNNMTKVRVFWSGKYVNTSKGVYKVSRCFVTGTQDNIGGRLPLKDVIIGAQLDKYNANTSVHYTAYYASTSDGDNYDLVKLIIDLVPAK